MAEAADGRELGRVEVHASSNGLDIPAAPPIWIAQRVAAGDVPEAGPVSLARWVRRRDAERWLGEAGYTIRETGAG